MSIRIGSSCALNVAMAWGKVVETRILTDQSSDWKNVCKHAIANKIFLILTPCVNNGYNIGTIPSDSAWQNTITSACQFLKSIGGNYNNARISLINEPMKFITREQYKHYIDLAYPIIKSYGFLCGAGNEEFVMSSAHGNMYQYILDNCKFDILDIHIQGSCDTQAHIDEYKAEVQSWINYWKVPADCTEAFYGNITTSQGWNLLLAQLQMAKDLKCNNFCNVFNNIDTSVFPILSNPDVANKWYELCFNINGVQHSKYWQLWLDQMEINKPVPNIIEIIRSKDGMILPSVKLGTKGYLTEYVEEVLEYLGFDIDEVDGLFTASDVSALTAFQLAIKDKYPNIDIDGICGRKCYFYLTNEIPDSIDRDRYRFKLEVYGSPVS